MAGTPAGFDADSVRAGLRTAMQFGLPSVAAERPTFFMPQTLTSSDPLDDEGIPFDAGVEPTLSTLVRKTVDCAVEYFDGAGKMENFGVLVPSKVVLTILDQQYTQIRGFQYVVIQGQRYDYEKTEPPVALGTVDVYTIHCRTGDDG